MPWPHPLPVRTNTGSAAAPGAAASAAATTAANRYALMVRTLAPYAVHATGARADGDCACPAAAPSAPRPVRLVAVRPRPRTGRGRRACLAGDVPREVGSVEAVRDPVAVHVAGTGVLGEGVERVSLVRD